MPRAADAVALLDEHEVVEARPCRRAIAAPMPENPAPMIATSCVGRGSVGHRATGSVAALRGSIRIFAWLSGSPSAVERGVDAVEPDLAGDQRPRVDLALGEHVQRVAELERRVADHEAQVDLLVDRHRRA